MLTSTTFKNSQIKYHFNNNIISPSAKTSTNNFLYTYTNESPKSNNLKDVNTYISSKLLKIYNSANCNFRKYSSINLQTTASKNQIISSSN